jgi:predicted nucleotidyltransferase/DNA-binding XRE family transcriptional regulator
LTPTTVPGSAARRDVETTYQLIRFWIVVVDSAGRGSALRAARQATGLTQAELAARVGVAAPNIAGYEAGKRQLSDSLFERIMRAARPLPSELLKANVEQVRQIAYRHGATRISVFGSVARGHDRFDSDIDLLVELRPGTDLFDLYEMAEEIERLLNTHVDVVSAGGLTRRHDEIKAQAVPL